VKEGEAFNISKIWPEIRIPLGMLKDREVTFCAKVIYGLLVRYAGSAGYCSIYQDRISKDLQISKVLVKKNIKILRDQKYIATKLQGRGNPAIYYFLWRKEFRSSTGGVNRININPEVHKNILQYYRSKESKEQEYKGQGRKKGSAEGKLRSIT